MWDLIVSVPDHCLSFYFLWYERLGQADVAERDVTNLRNSSNDHLMPAHLPSSCVSTYLCTKLYFYRVS